ncbi:MAG: hypothetical protein O3A46_12265 [Candidatus Poribacteria bacterium]|nr:hypothetical protein [Candidatus Poribacteria bacterium]
MDSGRRTSVAESYDTADHASTEILRVKLDTSERTRAELGSVRESLDHAHGEIDNLRSISANLAESVLSITDEVKALPATNPIPAEIASPKPNIFVRLFRWRSF